MLKRKIENIYRIDYLKPEERVEDEPFGLFIQLDQGKTGIRFNIDNSGQNIEYEIQSIDIFLNFFNTSLIYVEKIGANSLLFKLVGTRIKKIKVAYINERIVQGLGFVSIDRDAIALQIVSDYVLTFFNDGDEGKFSYNIFESQVPFLHESVKWYDLYLPG